MAIRSELFIRLRLGSDPGKDCADLGQFSARNLSENYEEGGSLSVQVPASTVDQEVVLIGITELGLLAVHTRPVLSTETEGQDLLIEVDDGAIPTAVFTVSPLEGKRIGYAVLTTGAVGNTLYLSNASSVDLQVQITYAGTSP